MAWRKEGVSRPHAYELHTIDTASEEADFRASSSGLMLADFECVHGLLEGCEVCLK